MEVPGEVDAFAEDFKKSTPKHRLLQASHFSSLAFYEQLLIDATTNPMVFYNKPTCIL